MSKSNYDASSIQILEGLEAVRKRPGMYIGSTDARGLHHLVWEIVDNSIDEALNGFGNKITITIEKDNVIRVDDEGRGMPVEKHASGISTLAVIHTVLHAGGKFSDEGGYKTSGGLHGVGASVVNALCKWMEVCVSRDNKRYRMLFSDGGKKTSQLEIIGKSNKTGSTTRFKPDDCIFSTTEFSYQTICQRAREDAFLLPGITLVVKDERKDPIREEVFHYENGLTAFLKDLLIDKETFHEPVRFDGEMNGIKVSCAFQYSDTYQENIFSYVNIVRTKDGGTHETGIKNAFTKVFNDYAKKSGILKEKDKKLEGSDVREGLNLILSLSIPEHLLQFEGQTKGKLGTPQAKSVVESIISEKLSYFLMENKELALTLTRKMYKASLVRKKAQEVRDDARKNKSKSERVLSGKLAQAQSKDARKKELYLVEGDSAGGSAKKGRDSKYQAILPLRGKVLNTEKASMASIDKNVELYTIIHALGAGVGANFHAEDSNYHKVIIMTDADDDGAHIQILLLTFFYRFMRELIEKGMVYIAMPPLYKLQKGKQIAYAWTNEELEKLRKSFPKGYSLQRYKGLGEMNADQLWDTTMCPQTRTLIQVSIDDAMMAEKQVSVLMGDKANLRRDWIEENVQFTLEDDYQNEVNS